MDETLLLPSPNWFFPSVMAVTPDDWLIYGGPNKTLCVLEPLSEDVGVVAAKEKYQAHVFFCGNSDKVIAVEISPVWSEKKLFLCGILDGTVLQCVLETVNSKIKIKETHCHVVHKTEHEELIGIGYCNERMAVSVGASTVIKWDLSSNVTKVYPSFMRGFKPTCMACSQHTSLQVAIGTKQGVIFLVDLHGKGKIVYKIRGQDDIVMNISWCPQYVMTVNKSVKEYKSLLSKRLSAIRREGEIETNALEQSGIGKTLPEDSFDESIVKEDDMFDIYKDFEPDEFGHKKYEPEDILVKGKKENADETDYLADCLKLKEEILRRKNQTEPTIESLVDALDNTHVETGADVQSVQTDIESGPSQHKSVQSHPKSTITCAKIDKTNTNNKQSHKLLLASVGKFGGVKIWSGTGKLVGACTIPIPPRTQKIPFSTSLLWFRPDSLIVCDGKNQVLEINPHNVDSRNQLEWKILHQKHKRGLYCIKTNAPRIQSESKESSKDWSVWTVGQDRNIIRYCVRTKKVLAYHATCGGSIYSVVPCPYDAGKIAVSVGDGAIRVLESSTLFENDTRLSPARVTTYWQHVQGKVLSVAWHPTKENLLAYGTGDSRVGLIETSGNPEVPARVLNNALTHGVYSLSWGEGKLLYASGGNKLVVYRTNVINEDPELIDITIEGQLWAICAVSWSPRGLLVGSCSGAVALLTHERPHTLITAAFLFNKIIHALEWHPQQTSNSSEESPYKNLIVVTSLDKCFNIYILEYGTNEEDGTRQLTTWKILSGHKRAALQATWSPHRDELLLSSSQDSSVRVWDILAGTCISVFGGHSYSSLGVCWVTHPQLPHHVLSGGGENCLRLWDIYHHKPEDYTECLNRTKKVSRRKEVKKESNEPGAASTGEEQDNVAISMDLSYKTLKPARKFLLPIMFKQVNDRFKLQAPRKILQMFVQKTDPTGKKGDGMHNVNKEKPDIVVDDKGDSITVKEQADTLTSSTTGDGKDVTENTSAQETVDTKASTVEKPQITEIGNVAGEKDIDLDFLKVFGSIKEVNEFLDLEMENHLHGYYNPEACIMLLIFRGRIDTMIQFASERDMLCPFLLSMAPCVSFKYWKDATQLYLAQIDRLVARNEETKLYENKAYGGPTFWKAAILLSMHDVVGAVDALCEGKLFKEAYILCRLRYMDSVAEEIMEKWAIELSHSGQKAVTALLYIVMGNLSEAAQELAKSERQDFLGLAAEIAKVAGRTTFADQVQKKANLSKSKEASENTEELLKELPSKIELLMRSIPGNSVSLESDTLNGETLKSDKLNGDK